MTAPPHGTPVDVRQRLRKVYLRFAVALIAVLYLSVCMALGAVVADGPFAETGAWLCAAAANTAAVCLLILAALIARSTLPDGVQQQHRLRHADLLTQVGSWLAATATIGSPAIATTVARPTFASHWPAVVLAAALWPALTWWCARQLRKVSIAAASATTEPSSTPSDT